MPFWWKRRKRPWFGRWRWRKRYNRYKNRKTRKRYARRRPRRFTRRRRRRRRKYKVRRKRPTITLKQWQPDSVVFCKIKGQELLILGAEGRQMRLFTDVKGDTVPPRTPTGGGSAYWVPTLGYLYSELKFHANIWTKSNIYKDLCRYLKVKITAFRHPSIDFILQYDRQPPYNVNKTTYMSTHPQQLLQQKHHKVILSTQTNPNGKLYKKFTVRPPKLMIQKWFFTDAFSKYPLLLLKASAADFKYSYLQCCNENQQLNMYYLDILFYLNGNYASTTTRGGYLPYATAPTGKSTWTVKYISGKREQIQIDTTNYNTSISYTSGWFTSKLLRAIALWHDTLRTTEEEQKNPSANLPVNNCIYNPNLDSGKDNMIFLHSIHKESWAPPTTDLELIIPNVPLWLGLWGLFDYVNKIKNSSKDEFLKTHIVGLRSTALLYLPQSGSSKTIVPLDKAFINGNTFFDQIPTYHDKQFWYPTCLNQQQILNAIVETGPFVPKLGNITNSTWELKINYNFQFKWGGPHITDPEIMDPKNQGHWDDDPRPNNATVQIKNPEKQKSESFIQPWDLRRGFIKESALKRVYENLSIDTSFQPTETGSPPKAKKRKLPTVKTQEQKNKKVLSCLHSLYEESTCQDQTPQTLQQLIQQQQEQQHQLKRNILQLIFDLKRRQELLQLQSGFIN
nr:MAG: ORF1 [Torque teno midi virus]